MQNKRKCRESYIGSNRSLHELENGLAYHSYEGCHFKVFRDYEDGMKWLEDGDNSLVIDEFDKEIDMDEWLEDAPVFAKKYGNILELHQSEDRLFKIEKFYSQWQAENCIGGATFSGYKTLKECVADMEKRYNIVVVNLKNI